MTVALDRAGDLVAVAAHVDVRDLLGLAVQLPPEDDGAVGRHGHGDGVVAHDALVAAANVEAAGAEGLERVADPDVGDADGGDGLVGLKRWREDGRDHVRVGAEAGGDAAEGLELGGGVELLEVADLLKGLHVAELHAGLLRVWVVCDQSIRLPPSTLSACPVMYDESSEARKATTAACSSTVAWRPMRSARRMAALEVPGSWPATSS